METTTPEDVMTEAFETAARNAACGTCRNRGPACGNCVFQSVIQPLGVRQRDFDPDERAAIAALAGQGLVPPLRLAPLRAA